MENFIPPYLFLKFGKTDHLKDLQENGHLYCNTFKYFTEIEDGNVRGDINEGLFYLPINIRALHNKNFPNGKLNVNNVPGLLKFRNDIGNIFSLYSIDTRNYKETFKYQFDDSIDGFDRACLIIYNVTEFVNRIKKALKKEGLGYQMDFVKYCDLETHTNEKGPFIKDKIYDKQNEYRIVIYKETNLPNSIYIGNIEDISILSNKGASDLDLEFCYS